MIIKNLILSSNVVLWLFCAITGDVHAWASLKNGADTHKDITKNVLNNYLVDANLNLALDYPDLVKFGEQLRDGSNTESHNIPDGLDMEWWKPDPETWFTADRVMEERTEGGTHPEYGALWAYTNYVFNGAYLRIGYELHLVQDESVPAHQNYCFHGQAPKLFDWLEAEASAFHSYSKAITPWSYSKTYHDGTYTFQYWLSDAMDDDDRDDEACWDDEWDLACFPIEDGPAAYGVPDTDWGTYGQPAEYADDLTYLKLRESLPGRNEGIDYFGSAVNVEIIREQLQVAYDATLIRMKERSIALPPLVPDDETNGKPNISLKIFGPNKPVEISFVAMENRKPTVFVSVLAGTAGGIMDYNSFKVLDGGDNSTRDLLPWDVLPWKSHIICKWTGDTATGQIDDGEHVITMKIKDQDNHFSEVRTRSVKFDKTIPTGTITVNCYPKKSSP